MYMYGHPLYESKCNEFATLDTHAYAHTREIEREREREKAQRGLHGACVPALALEYLNERERESVCVCV